MMTIDGGQINRRKFLQTGVTAAASFGLFGPRRVLGAEAAETMNKVTVLSTAEWLMPLTLAENVPAVLNRLSGVYYPG